MARDIVEVVAIVAAGVWAFYTFVYQEKIKPAREPAALNPLVDVRVLGRDAKREILGVSLHLHNDGKTEIDIAADAFNLWGDRFAERQSTQERASFQYRTYFHGLRRTSRTLIASRAELRQGTIGGPSTNITIEPQAEQLLSFVVVVPRHAYDVIHAQVAAVPIKTHSPHVAVTIARNKDGSSWLQNPDEDDSEADFALPP